MGSGEGLVVAASRRVDDGYWHNVSVERIGSSAFISVDGSHRGEGSSPGSNEMLNLESQRMYLGAEVRSWTGDDDPRQGFVGCIDSPRVDNVPLPLGHDTTTGVASLTRLAHVLPHCFGPLQPPGACGTHPCLNGGTCNEIGSSFVCLCHPRFKGERCENDSNPCASSPCLNNGHCVKTKDSYRCECPAQVSGPRCQYMYCNPNPCLNEGLCEEGISGPICKCEGFTGAYCNVDLNECDRNPCQSGGTCMNTLGSFKCMCPSNTTGIFCDMPISAAITINIEEVSFIFILYTALCTSFKGLHHHFPEV